MKILFISLGCDKNLADSEEMLGLLTGSGHEIVDSEEEADAIVINTCCFIHDAKEESINTILQMAEKMSYNPAKILHLANKGSLKPGKDADVVVIDPKESYVIDVKDFVSKGKNTPFQGKKVNGKVKVTICGGRVVYEDK